MTSFVHIDYPTQHPGVQRAEQAVAAVRQAAARFDGTHAVLSLLAAPAHALGAAFARARQARREAAAERELLALAASDPRVMADLRVAATRQDVRDLRWYF